MILRLALVVILFAFCCSGCSRQAKKKTLLVSFDGFRADYFKKTSLHNFAEVAKTGVTADNITGTFSTKSFPAHYSIATGLYQENHGIQGNHFYDPVLGQFDRTNSSQVRDPRWWLGEPIWRTVRRQKKKAGTYFWPGSETALSDSSVDARFVKEYDKTVPFKDRVDQVLKWFTEDDVDFATVYYHEPDLTGHLHGPDSPEVVKVLEEVDGYLGYLLQQLKKKDLWDTVNLVVVSDHGMTYMKQENIINLVELPNFRESDVKFTADWGTTCQIEPAENSLDNLYNVLRNAHPNMTVWKKEDFPKEKRFANSDRVRPIIVIANEGYNVRLKNISKYKLYDVGTHGYDNDLPSMKTMFRARGPDFRPAYTAKPFSIVDIYPILCEITGVTPAPNNGSLSKLSGMLQPRPIGAADRGRISCALFLLIIFFPLLP